MEYLDGMSPMHWPHVSGVEIMLMKCPDRLQLANSHLVPRFHGRHIKLEGRGQHIQGLLQQPEPVVIGSTGTKTVPAITTTIDGVLRFSAEVPTTAANGNQQMASKPLDTGAPS
jgi:hypothetical protein